MKERKAFRRRAERLVRPEAGFLRGSDRRRRGQQRPPQKSQRTALPIRTFHFRFHPALHFPLTLLHERGPPIPCALDGGALLIEELNETQAIILSSIEAERCRCAANTGASPVFVGTSGLLAEQRNG